MHPDPCVKAEKRVMESWTCAGIRAGCPLWCQCWTHVFLSGCCCGPEAPRAREPEDLNESGTWETERERETGIYIPLPWLTIWLKFSDLHDVIELQPGVRGGVDQDVGQGVLMIALLIWKRNITSSSRSMMML